MSTALDKQVKNMPSLSVSEQELMSVLRNSLFVGAKDESIKMAVSYCRAAGLDIMQKPVHLVPMNVKKPNGEYEWRDVVMPGIGLYRTQASRTGEYAGMSEPIFGEEVTENLGGVSVTYPKHCLVIVKRMVGGNLVDFPAKEYWKENYATKKKDTAAPNAMWEKRPFAQLAKCAEAQALRKAFPEFGSAPTADEMEGKEIDVTPQAAAQEQAKETPILDDATFKTIADKYRKSVAEGKKTIGDFISWVESKGALMTESQKAEVSSWAVKQPSVVEGEATTVNDDFATAYEDAEKAGEK